MITSVALPSSKRHRLPPELISPAVWLTFRFSLSYRDVEKLLAARGIVVTYEIIRQWLIALRSFCKKAGQFKYLPWFKVDL